MDKLIQEIIKNYVLDENLTYDFMRNCDRIEIPAGFSFYLEGDKLIECLDLIIKKQSNSGFWEENSYSVDEEKTGGYGAIPTSFCILTLLNGFKILGEKKYLLAAIKGSDYLYSVENSGYFMKAKTNKSDVINTNLMCAVALLETSKLISVDSRKINIFRGACVRSIRRSLNSQFINGAFPYTSFGLTVPFLYHSMTLALLIRLSNEFDDSYLNYSILKGNTYLNKYISTNGKILWDLEKFKDKEGACWIYSWNYNIFKSLGDKKNIKITSQHLKNLKTRNYFMEG
ncbi:MAG: hypothetical protein HRU03_09475, partial [Nanoarchaeales archaeon]|nr:hypothetical protein [Nanoarchaeales archaeon]